MKCPGCREETVLICVSSTIKACNNCGWKAHIKVWNELKKEEEKWLSNGKDVKDVVKQ